MAKKVLNKKQMEALQRKAFETYPDRDKLHFTEDGNFFLDINPARNHARIAEIKLISASKTEIGKADHSDAEKARKEAEQKQTKAQAELKEQDLEKMEYPEMVDLLTDLGVETKDLADKKKETVLAKLKDLQAELNKAE